MKKLLLPIIISLMIISLCGFNSKAQFVTFAIQGATNTYITAINDSNEIAGYFENGTGIHGFIYDGVDTTILNYPGAVQTFIYGINNEGEIVGAYNNTGSNVDNEGFSYDNFLDLYTDITTSWLSSMTITTARDINDAHCIVGDYKQSTTHVCFSMCSGTNAPFHYNYNPTYINSINNSGKRAGLWIDGSNRHGLIYDAGNWAQIDYPGATRTELSSVNDSNVIVGIFDLTRSFIYKNGAFKEIKKWDAVDIKVKDINNNGYVVGYYKTNGGNYKGFYKPAWDIKFRPDPDGWLFNNSSPNMWPLSWYGRFDYRHDPYLGGVSLFPQITYANGAVDTVNRKFFPDWPLFVKTFGEENCYTNFLGVRILKNNAFNKWKSKLRFWGGSCFGFANSSFMAWDSIQRFKVAFPNVGPWTANNKLYELPINNENRLCINEIMIKQHQKGFKRHINTDAALSPKQTLRKLKKMMLDNEKDEQGLCFLNQNGSGGHIVNPYKVLVDTINPNFEWIYVYDNNYPGDTTRKVKVDKTLDSWYYDLAGNAGDPPAQWGGNNAHKGMFITWPSSSFYAKPIVDSVAKSPLTGEKSNYIEVYNTSASNIYLTNAANDTIGYVNNHLIEKMPGASAIIALTGGNSSPEGYIVPEAQYNVLMKDFSSPLINFSEFLDDNSYYYTRANATIAEKDRFVIDANGIKISNSDNNTKTIKVVSIASDANFEKTFDISDLNMTQNSSLTFNILLNDKLKIINQGAATTYDANIKYVSSTVSGTFTRNNLSIAANTTHTIVTNWTGIQTQDVCIYIDNGNNGINDDTLCFTNQGVPEILTYPNQIDASSVLTKDTIFVANPGAGSLSWTAASNATSWLTITSGSTGTNNGNVKISLAANTGAARTGNITFTASGAANSPYTIVVNQAGVINALPIITASDGNYSDGIHVSWNSVAGATHYMIYRSINGGNNGSAITGWINGTTYTDATALNGQFYYYSLKAAQNASGLNSTGFSNMDDGWRSCFTADFDFTGTCSGQPTIFTDNSAAHTYAHYLWDINNDGINEYSGDNFNHIYTSAATYTVVLTVTDSSLCTSTKQKSVVIKSFPSINLPESTTLQANQPLTLNAGNGFSSYLWSTGETTSSITVNSALYGLGCTPFYVQVTNSNGCTAIDTALITWTSITGIPQISNDFVLNIYPNPTNDKTNISVSGNAENTTIAMFNYNGQMVYNESIGNIIGSYFKTINTKELPSGIYFLRFVSNDIVKVNKVIIY
ncbi:MAG: T9SS type A sorting domain-containing protein [Bacteroidetes bacterium]|nr:T9SS type A sorting domain-containing protein [Bacteroidota bacterium]